MASHEFDLIDWIARQQPLSPQPLRVGIGDDAAVWRLSDGSELLLATDMLMEGTHFTFPPAEPAQVGHKALAVNLSDIAAMAGIPETALVSAAFPRSRGDEFAREVMSGLMHTAERFGVAVVGGDTNVWDGPLVINVAITGCTTPRGAILRSGAKPGDALFVTGPLGGSLAGKHLTFEPRVRESLRLAESIPLHAMIDLSDGLGSDVRHLLRAGNCGCVLFSDRIPIATAALVTHDERTPLERALFDGEDFELLFAVAPDDAERLLAQGEIPLHRIGEITSTPGECLLQHPDGARRPISDAGWKHEF